MANLTTLLAADAAMCYPGVAGTTWGGTYEAVAYHTGGGVPVATYTAFDWTSPGAWVRDGGAGWGSPSGAYVNQAEVALLVEWPAGLSSSGKPVNFRKWYHAVPEPGTESPGSVDISTAMAATLLTAATTLTNCLASSSLLMGNAGRFAGSPLISRYYANHQMPKGRRRRALVSASGRYTGPTISIPDMVIPD